MRLVLDIFMIRRARISRCLTIKDLSKMAGISYGAAIKAANHGRCGLKVAKALSQALGLSLDDLEHLTIDRILCR